MDTQGWSDIAYQIAIDQDANTYALRGMRYRSAANGDMETNLEWGAVLLVLAIGEQPSPKMIKATNKRLAIYRELMDNYEKVVGHQDVRPEPTQCPGKQVMDLIHSGKIK
jgi:hypothetical protein